MAMMKTIKLIKKFIKKLRKKKVKELYKKYPEYDIGRGTYGSPEIFTWDEGATLKVGSFCSIAAGVKIYLGGEHRMDWVTTYPFSLLWKTGRHIMGHPMTKGDVIIGNDVWIGTEAIIMSGVKIGDGAIVGARAVITKDIEPYSIYAGNPTFFLKKRFDERIIQQLLMLEWWNFKNEDIEQILPLMLNTDIQGFIDKARQIKKAISPPQLDK